MLNLTFQDEASQKRMKRSNREDTHAILDASKISRPSLPPLPDLIIHRLLTQLLPTKAAVRMSFLSRQWEGVWSLSPVLDFDESAELYDDAIVFNKLVEHMNFINILQRHLEYRKKHETPRILDRFRLRMTRFLLKDSDIVDKWLSFAFERGVNQVDLGLEIGWLKLAGDKVDWYERVEYLYCISPMSLFHAKSITTLNLESVRIQGTYNAKLKHVRVLPCLKNMSMKNVYLDFGALGRFILESPLIECLSLDSCCFKDSEVSISSASLKSLKVTHCNASRIEVNEVVNLEHFTLLSDFRLSSVTFKKSFNLKYINIHAPSLDKFVVLHPCHDIVEATIHTPGLVDCRFNCFMKSKMYMKDPNLHTCVIRLQDDYNEKSHNFEALRDFLEAFDGAGNINLHISDFRVISFPVKFRETYLSPLSRLKQLVLYMPNTPTKQKDMSDLIDSLTWLVPSKDFCWITY